MVTMGVFPFEGKTHMVEPGIEPGTSWLVVRSSDHQATRLVQYLNIEWGIILNLILKKYYDMSWTGSG